MSRKLTAPQIRKRMGSLPAWKCSKGKLHRQMKFRNFVEAFAFMTAIALEAEKMNHHPDWSNGYGQVEIWLQTHEVEGITEKDFSLAEKIDGIAATFLTKN